MSSEADKRKDLVSVLAAVLPDPNNDFAAVDKLLNEKFILRLGAWPRKFASEMCGHSLALADTPVLRVGGGGVVIQCVDADAPSVKYALKVARPSLFRIGKIANREKEKANQEQRVHLPLVHENIAKLYGTGRLKVQSHDDSVNFAELPCTLIEWVDDALPADKHIAQRVSSAHELAGIIAQACRALAHLHDSNQIHWDVKGDNVLVSGTGVVKLMDLGNARQRMDTGARYEKREHAESSYRNLPPKLHSRLPPEGSDSKISLNRGACELKAREVTWDEPWLDLYMLAREINGVLGFDSTATDKDKELGIERRHDAPACKKRIFGGEDGAYVFDFLSEIVSRILAVDCPGTDSFYNSAAEVARALDRLSPDYGEATDIPELQAVPQHVLRLPPNNNVPWTKRVDALMNSSPLLRLKRHRQLATVHHVFPGAEHTRWEHVAGSLGEMLQRIRSLYADRTSVAFRLYTSRLDVTALMLASLLHDLGHPAYGHQLEESPMVAKELKHEAYTLRVLRACLRASGEPSDEQNDAAAVRPVLDRFWGSVHFSVDELLNRTIDLLENTGPPDPSNAKETPAARIKRVHTELLSSLISGQLDADKADYLVRDALHCGVEYPNGIDRRRLDQALTSLIVQPDGESSRAIGTVGVTEKGILPLESLLIARYQMFRAVYWHRLVRALTVMLQEVVERYVVRSQAATAATMDRRVRELLTEFRKRSDEDAIRWVKAQLAPALADLSDGVLGEREHIFWYVTEVRGAPAQIHGDGSATATEDERLYNKIQDLWTGTDNNMLTTIRMRRSVRARVASAINDDAKKAGGVVSYRNLKESDLLLDIPLSGADDVRHLLVASGEGAVRKPIPLEQLTPLAHAVTQAFGRSVRPARVFLRPSIARKIAVADDWDEFVPAVEKAIRSAFDNQLKIESN